MSTWDLVVVGAGPAGSTAALAALRTDPSLRVLLLDRAVFPRDKSCGDGIAPHVRDVLDGLGAADVLDGWEPVRRLQLAHGGVAVDREMARPAWVVPRAVLDARLVDHAVAAGAVLRQHRVRSVVRTGDGAEVDGIPARVVIGADGAHSRVRAAVGLAPARRRALALRGYAPTPATRRGRQVIVFGEHRQPSYAWSFDRGDGWSNVGYGELLGRHAQGPSRALLLDRLEELLPGAGRGGEQWLGHHLPLSGWRWSQPDGPVLLAGDAAGLINPMTGEGIYYAVATGRAAGEAAARTPERAGTAHRTAVRALLATHLRHTTVTSRLSSVPVVVEAGLRAADRDRRVFDDLVEIGLGRGRITPRLAVGLARGLAGGRVPGRPVSTPFAPEE